MPPAAVADEPQNAATHINGRAMRASPRLPDSHGVQNKIPSLQDSPDYLPSWEDCGGVPSVYACHPWKVSPIRPPLNLRGLRAAPIHGRLGAGARAKKLTDT